MTREAVIGLEIHVQLATASKAFCACPSRFGDPPNTNVCPVCLGMPGALPVPNARAVELALRTALALGCDVPEVSVFARKNYFYPDLPKGYQITQFDRPLATGGRIPFEVDGEARDVALQRVHLEEDAGKSLHDETGTGGPTRVDLNRCGTPLLEIVSEPALRRPEEAGAVLRSLRRLVRWIGVSEGEMSRGNLRCDANVSVREPGGRPGTKTEVKNLNSIRMVERAIAREVRRQTGALDAGHPVEAATLLWDDRAGELRPMRSKEDAPDYRYFPDPDLPPLRVTAERRERARAALPELPIARRARFVAEWSLSRGEAAVLTESRDVADFFEEVARACGDGRLAAHWMAGEIMRRMNEEGVGVDALGIDGTRLGELLGLVRGGEISATAARKVFAAMRGTDRSARSILEEQGLPQISDAERLAAIVEDVVARHPDQANRVRRGERKLIDYLVGQVMKASGGRANPAVARAILERTLGRTS